MSKILKIYLTLACVLFANFSLLAADFTIYGKVSLIQESVPLPFYDVHIADGEGKYVKTVKTSFNGSYKVTFDIPTDDKVSFEVSVIDRCTGQAIITAFEKEGEEFKANYLVCSEVIEEETSCKAKFEYEVNGLDVQFQDNSEGNVTTWEWDFGDGNNSNEATPLHTYETEGEYKVTLIVNGENCEDKKQKTIHLKTEGEEDDCNCTAEFDPVCAETNFGINIIFPNACLAECAGYSDYFSCVGDDNDEDGKGEGFDCEELGIQIPVCVKLDNGEILNFPNPCEAKEAGYEISQFTFCGDGPGGTDSLDCEALGIDFPVCAADKDGTIITYANPCEAIAAGADWENFKPCSGINEDLNCNQLGLDLLIPVCVTDAATGETTETFLCDALEAGIALEELTFCNNGNLFDNIDCDSLGIEIAVCAKDADGNITNFDNPCDALNAGFEVNQLTLCDGLLGNGLEDIDCEALGIDLPISVCVINDEGLSLQWNLCDALKEGVPLENIEFCDGGIGGLDSLIDCEALELNIPVCVTDSEGNMVEFANPCDAIEGGYAINQLTICESFIGDELANIDCEAISDLPVAVCAVNADGESVEVDLCQAIKDGVSLVDIELCEGSIGSLDDLVDCEKLGINVPVCVVDGDGNSIEFANPCDALMGGFTIDQLNICDGFIGGENGALSCEGLGINVPVTVCYTNDANETVSLPICDALSQGISLEDIEFCEGSINEETFDCEELGLNMPVCVEDAAGQTIKFDNPCDALKAGYKIEDFGFCGNLLGGLEDAFNSTDTEEEEVIIERAEMFPNPVLQELNFVLNFAKNTDFEVRILSINGNAIYRQNFNATNGENMVQMDVSSLNSGIYLAQVVTNRGIKTLKFVKS